MDFSYLPLNLSFSLYCFLERVLRIINRSFFLSFILQFSSTIFSSSFLLVSSITLSRLAFFYSKNHLQSQILTPQFQILMKVIFLFECWSFYFWRSTFSSLTLPLLVLFGLRSRHDQLLDALLLQVLLLINSPQVLLSNSFKLLHTAFLFSQTRYHSFYSDFSAFVLNE